MFIPVPLFDLEEINQLFIAFNCFNCVSRAQLRGIYHFHEKRIRMEMKGDAAKSKVNYFMIIIMRRRGGRMQKIK